MKNNWQSKIGSPYSEWEPAQLSSYLKSKGYEVKKGTEQNKDSLISQVKANWHENADSASDSYHSMKDWIFDKLPTSLGSNRAKLLTFFHAAGLTRN